MNAVWFILAVAVLNTCVGFAIAVHLGRRYRAVAEEGTDWDFDGGFAWPDTRETPSGSESANAADASGESGDTETRNPSADATGGSDTSAPSLEAAPIPESGDTETRNHAADANGGSRASTQDGSSGIERRDESNRHAELTELSDRVPGQAGVGAETLETAERLATESATIPGESDPVARNRDSSESGIEAGWSPEAVSVESSPETAGDAANARPDTEMPAAAVPLKSAGSIESDDTEPPPGPAAATSAHEKAVEAFLKEVEQYQGQLDRADTELRSQAEKPDGDSIRACLQSLLEASREYSEQREQARATLDGVKGESPEFGVVSERLQSAVRGQDEQIESTERAIVSFPYVDDLTQGCHVMIGETARLMDANLLVRDALQQVDITAARGENRLADLAPHKQRDALTGTESRAALERALSECLGTGDQHVDVLSVAAIDVDEFSQVNRQFGHAVGDQLLQGLGKLLTAENRTKAHLARFSGERFVLLFYEAELRTTVNAVERLRQIVETACFEYRKKEIRITVSCGVAEAAPGDTPDRILARAEATLMEAKRYGRNRTFIHEGKYPTPVVPPKFAIEPRRMTL